MCSTVEHQRAKERANQALHDAIVRMPGGSRFMRHGKSIKPMGPKLAAEVIHRTHDEIRNMADPNKPDHRFYAEDLHQLLLEGMDPVWFEECLRDVGIICIPDHSGETPRKGLTDEVLRCIKEFGDVGAAIRNAMDDQSRGGRRITNKENITIQREIDEAIEELQQLSKAVNQEVKS